MKKAIYQRKGDSIDYIPSSAVAAGDVIFFGDVAAVAKLDIPAGSLGDFATVGVYDVEKDGKQIAVGAPVYYNAVTGASATNSGTDKVMGVAVAAATADAATVSVLLNAVKADKDTVYTPTAAANIAALSLTSVTGAAGSEVYAAGENSAHLIADLLAIKAKLNAVLSALEANGIVAEAE